MNINRLVLILMTLCVGFTAHADDDEFLELSLGDLLNMEVESASRQKESLREAPVPVTVITKEMIKTSGARTTHEALMIFVPGYTDAEDRNELNFAPRGIYATSQQKVLIMVNGHRINSRSYLTSMPDYGIALHNIERIEVLRGPGSSLYGNVALSGVINLITKKGKDLKKNTMFDGSFGNAGQGRVRFLHGTGTEDSDVLLWGQFYRANGSRQELTSDDSHFVTGANPGELQIDRVDDPPAHDFGINYTKDNWTFFGASRQTNWGEPYANNGKAGAYEYTDFRNFRGTGPGLSLEHRHLGAKYQNSIGDWGFTFNPYFDTTNIEGILVTSAAKNGLLISWQDQNIGLVTTVDKSYENFLGGKGSFLFGIQVDAFEVYDSIILGLASGNYSGAIGNDPTTGLPSAASTPGNQLLEVGSEAIYSAFFQDKHFFSDSFILNFGARFDVKNRRSGNDREKISPRVALIYLPNENYEFKLSYSQSFVDSPYWYRYNSLSLFGGSVNTDPEVLNATQFQFVYSSDDKKIRNSTVLYYQNGTDLLTFKGSAAGTEDDPKYINSGRIESIGLENEFAYLEAKWQAFFNFQYYQATSTIDYTTFDDMFAHVPSITANVIFNYYLSKDFSTNLTVRFLGEQKYDDGTGSAVNVDSAFLVNLGARHENLLLDGLYLDARIYNVTDQEHHQGGQGGSQVPYLQAGLWYLATIGYEF